jgi:hypothetical protein
LSDETEVAENGQLWRNMDENLDRSDIVAFPYRCAP